MIFDKSLLISQDYLLELFSEIEETKNKRKLDNIDKLVEDYNFSWAFIHNTKSEKFLELYRSFITDAIGLTKNEKSEIKTHQVLTMIIPLKNIIDLRKEKK